MTKADLIYENNRILKNNTSLQAGIKITEERNKELVQENNRLIKCNKELHELNSHLHESSIKLSQSNDIIKALKVRTISMKKAIKHLNKAL